MGAAADAFSALSNANRRLLERSGANTWVRGNQDYSDALAYDVYEPTSDGRQIIHMGGPILAPYTASQPFAG